MQRQLEFEVGGDKIRTAAKFDLYAYCTICGTKKYEYFTLTTLEAIILLTDWLKNLRYLLTVTQCCDNTMQ